MTAVATPPPALEEMRKRRRFSGKKLERLLHRLGKKPAWAAEGADVSESSVRNWLAGKKPDIDSYLDFVDFLKREGIDESEILAIVEE